VKPGRVEPARRPGPPPRGGPNAWQVVAIIAVIAATAGWTTVGVMALRDNGSAAVENPSDSFSFDPNASDDSSVAPVPHDMPDLEALLPPAVNGSPMTFDSLKGDGYLVGDDWSTSVTGFLTSVGKTPADLQVAEANDPDGALDLVVTVFRVPGVDGTALRDALIKAYRGDFPTLKTSDVTLGGKTVTKGDFGADASGSFFFVKGELVYDISTSDQAIATAALAAIPGSGASAPAGSPAPASIAPAASGSTAPSP
jgi:hypothetical protein